MKVTILLCVFESLLSRYSSTLLQVWFIAHQEYHYIMFCMLAELREPLLDVVERLRFRNVIHEERANSIPIVCVRDSSVPFLASSVPDLCADLLVLHLDVPSRKFHSDGWLRVFLELVLCVAQEEVWLSYPWIPDEHYFEKVVIMLVLREVAPKWGLEAWWWLVRLINRIHF